jgi:hypothetical protein
MNKYVKVILFFSTVTGLSNVWAATLTLASTLRQFPLTEPGVQERFTKVLDAETGTVHLLNGDGQRIPIQLLRDKEIAEDLAQAKLLKAMSRSLHGRYKAMGMWDRVKVVITAKYPPFSYPDKTTSNIEKQMAASLAASALAPVAAVSTIASRYGIVFAGSMMDLPASDENTSVPFYEVANSAFNPGSVPFGSGLGVRAATFEYGLSSNYLNCLGVTPSLWDAYSTSNPTDQRHSQATFLCLAKAAPSASLYHRKSLSFDGANDVNYLINNAIQTVSMSKARGGTAPVHSTYAEFLTMDDFAYRYPYPVFVTPTDNSGYSYEVNWQGYNAISVGNVRHTNNSAYELAECTQTKNPPPVYGGCIAGTSGSNCAGDREMPYIVAPGSPSSGSDFSTACLDGDFSLSCGTSWSAPILNGIAADVIAADSRLANWPEKVRATLILTAQNVDGGDWSVSADERDGTGVVSGSEAVSFAHSHSTVSPGNPAAEKGLGSGAMYASDFTGGNKRFNFLVPNTKPNGMHLRVVLTWDSNPVVGGSTNALSDLDLTVQSNVGTQTSSSWDSNVEVVDVAAGNLTAGGSYYIDISPYANRIPASGSRTNFFYYAIAWGWVKDHAP